MRALLGLTGSLLLGLSTAGLAEPGKCEVGELIELPVTMHGLRPMTTIKLDGKDAAFIVDSGAFFNLISPGVAASLKLKVEPTDASMLGIGGSASVGVARVKHTSFGRWDVPNVVFVVGGSEVGATGVLGQNLLNMADVEYDLANGMVRLFRAGRCGGANLAYWAKDGAYALLDLVPVTSEDRQTRAAVLLNGVKLRAVFDSGAPNTLLSLEAAARAGVKPGDPGVTASGEVSGFGRGITRGWQASFASLKIGDEEIRKAKLRFAAMNLPNIDLLIGADFFLSHRIFVANSQHRMFFTYAGGPVFNLEASRADTTPVVATALPAGQAATADAYARQGAIFATRKDLPRALDAYDRAVALDAKAPHLLLARAEIEAEMGRHDAARADLDRALALAPDDIDGRLRRAAIRLRHDDAAGARADLEAASAAATASDDRRLAMANLYDALHDRPKAIAQLDLWIRAHPDDSRMPIALNDRCWARALAGEALDRALNDCNASLRRRRQASTLDSRAFVQMRLGRLDAAIADYDAALAITPTLAPSLYGRGVARLRKGLKNEGDADIKAALGIDPRAGDTLKAAGFGA